MKEFETNFGTFSKTAIRKSIVINCVNVKQRRIVINCGKRAT